MKQGFNDLVCAEWLPDGRGMRLTRDIVFTDSKDLEWTARQGSVIDGASIPKFLWGKTGSPFVGLYRRASTIHDVYCVNQLRSWQDTHRVFREMMIFDGVPKWKARKMYYAVKYFGPRW